MTFFVEVPMVFDGLVSLALPAEEGPPLPTSWLDGIERLLFTGRWHRRDATCPLSSAVVLARCHAVLGGRGRIRVDSDADEAIDLTVPVDADDHWAERLPGSWTDHPCAFRLRTSWRTDDIEHAVVLRYAPRHVRASGGLVGAVRVAWVPEPFDPDRVRLRDRDLSALYRSLARHGALACETLVNELAAAFDCPGSHRGRVIVPVGEPGRFEELLGGLTPAPIARVARIAGEARGPWPAVDGDGVEGRVSYGTFWPVAEVTNAV